MRVIQNDQYIRSRGRIGRYIFFAGFGALIVGLLISLGPQSLDLFPLSVACLVLGLILSQAGGYYMRRFDRGELPHVRITQALKGFDDRYTLVNYGTPASHVLITPDTVYVLTVKPQAGSITYVNGRWKNPTGLRRIFTWMTEEGLGNPAREAASELSRFQRFIARQIPDTPIEAQPLIVFTHPTAEVEAGASPIPAVHVKKVKDWLRSRPKGGLTADARTALQRFFKQD